MSSPIQDADVDLIVDTSPVQAIDVTDVSVAPPAAIDVVGISSSGGGTVPEGGTVGQHLAKKNATDFNTEWVTPHEIPAGGTTGKVLAKNSATDFDTVWVDNAAVPTGGATGEHLAKKSGTDYDAQWVPAPQMPIYDECGSLAEWAVPLGAASVATNVADSAAGGNVFRATGAPYTAMTRSGTLVPYDPNALYRISYRVRTTSLTGGTCGLYAGLAGVAYDGVALVNTAGSDTISGQHYVACNGASLSVAAGWQTFTGYVRGVATTGSNGVGGTVPGAPGRMHQNTRYIRPHFQVNWNAGTGVVEVDYVSLEIVPEPEQLFPIYDECGSLTNWTQSTGTAGTVTVASITDAGAVGGKVIRCVNASLIYRTASLVPYDPTALYRVKIRLRQTVDSSPAGKTAVHMGLIGYAADGVTVVDRTGGTAVSSAHYVAIAGTVQLTPAMGWVEYVGYAKGTAATGAQAPTSATAPGAMHQNVRYVQPIAFVNHSGGNGTCEIDYVSLEIVPPTAIATSGTEITLSGDGAGTPLSAALTGTVSGKDLNIPGGNLVAGDAAVTTIRMLSSVRLDGGVVYQTDLYTGTGGLGAIRLQADTSEKLLLVLNPDGNLYTRSLGSGGSMRPIPFATSAGQVSITISAAIQTSVVVTFPTNRFTQIPIVTMGSTSYVFHALAFNATASQFSVGIRHIDNASSSGTWQVNWMAVQMTPTSKPTDPQPSVREDGPTHTSTCHTEGCENEGIPITGPWEEGCGGVVCGACGQAITDSVTG